MGTALIYLVVMVLVAAVVFLLAAVVFGRGEEMAPLPPGSSPTRLPAADVTADDVSRVRFQQVFRGYKMSEVDWAMARLGSEIDTLRARVAELQPTAEVDGSAGDGGLAGEGGATDIGGVTDLGDRTGSGASTDSADESCGWARPDDSEGNPP